MRAAFSAALDAEPAEVRDRVTLRAGSVGSLAPVTGGQRYDAVLLLGVLMYLQASGPVGATDPYRQLGQLAHLILRRTPAES